ncbi:hypothetical protein CHARACLAT_028179 [Characodon lateralis]|uniref:Uncharacterized protein n=1 Tax=Characodon lateralis TaxID=208331 RepID=A0ABU7F758_9TELE|nr:hypothetical protein [Characodon lateralis]
MSNSYAATPAGHTLILHTSTLKTVGSASLAAFPTQGTDLCRGTAFGTRGLANNCQVHYRHQLVDRTGLTPGAEKHLDKRTCGLHCNITNLDLCHPSRQKKLWGIRARGHQNLALGE